jgi:p-cumate 2,3-dioxygenase alpha subunit
MIDQRVLPMHFEYLAYANAKEVGWNDISRGMTKAEPATVDEHQIRTFWRQWDTLVQRGLSQKNSSNQS